MLGMEKHMKVAVYARVSTRDKQDTENQLLQLREFAAKNDWQVVNVYVDKVSGTKGRDKRPQFDAMFGAASRREFDLVLFWALDRFSREGTTTTLNYLKALTSYGVKFRSYMEQYIDSAGPFAEAVIGIISAIASMERERIRERIRAGLARARRNGTRSGKAFGRPPKSDDCKMVDKVSALKSCGKSLRQIATDCNIAVNTVRKIIEAN